MNTTERIPRSVLILMALASWGILSAGTPADWKVLKLPQPDSLLRSAAALRMAGLPSRPILNLRLGLSDLSSDGNRARLDARLRDMEQETRYFMGQPFQLAAIQEWHLQHTPRGWPAYGSATSDFGRRVSPLHGDVRFHTGIDIANSEGTPIRSTADGVVLFAGWAKGYGQVVLVDHGNGFKSLYAHNSHNAVQEGDRVERGQTIAYMGSSGDSTASHVHYEVWRNGDCVNPWKYVEPDLLSADRRNLPSLYISL